MIYVRCQMKWLLYGLLSILLVSLNSCIDGEEEVFLNADGSGRMKVQYRVPGMLLSQREADELVAIIDKEVGEKDNLQLVANRVDSQKGQKIIRIEIEAKNVVELDGMLDDHGEGSESEATGKTDKILHALLGEMEVTISGLSASVKRAVDLDPLLHEYLGKNGSVLLGESEFRYTVHLPEAVEQSNAHETSQDGKTLKWVYKLRECKQTPINMHLQAPISIPWWGYAGGGVLVCALFGGSYRLFQNSRKKSIA